MKNLLFITACFYLCNLSYSIAKSKNLTLELVQVLFRHGDRYPDVGERKIDKSDKYNDVLKNFEDYGKLTKKGMLREYNFGKMLRERYNDFLGPYKSEEVYARSTDFERTKMTLQLALAGLYPPTENTSWSNEVNWLPIPMNYNPLQSDFLRVTTNGDCVKKGELLKEIENLPEFKKRAKLYRDLYETLKQKTNIKEFRVKNLFKVYTYIRSLLAMDLPIPDWCTEEDFKKLEEVANLHYESFGMTAAFRKATAGPTIDEFKSKIFTRKMRDIKIYLYAAHEINIATFVQAHNFTGIPSIPDFGSAVIIETLRNRAQTYLKIFYWTGVSEKLIPVHLKGCDHLCPLEQYIADVRPMIPNNDDKICFSASRFCSKKSNQQLSSLLNLSYN